MAGVFGYTGSLKTTIDNLIAGAKNRANHTGTQAASTVTGLAAVATSGSYADLTGKPTSTATGTNTGDQTLALSGTSLTISGANGNTVTIPSSGAAASDASTTTKGVVQLAGDLAGTAAAPTVPGLAAKAPLASPAFTGTPTVPTAAAGTATTQVASTAFVGQAVSAVSAGSVSDATTGAKGIVQLAGDLAGTATAPTVPALATKVNSSTYTAGLAAKADVLVPTAVKTVAYTAAAGDLVPVDASSAAFTVTLPTAPTTGARVVVKKIDAGTNTVTVGTGGSDVLNKTGGSTSVTLQLTNQAIQFQYAAGIWYVVSSDVPLTGLDARFAPVGPRTQVLVYSGSAYPARPSTTICPAGWATYKGPVQPTDWLANDEWSKNS